MEDNITNVVVIGANGQDGRLASDEFLKAGYRVIGVLRPGDKRRLSKSVSTYVEADFTWQKNVTKILNRFSPALIFHLAAIHSSSESQQVVEDLRHLEIQEVSVSITRNILEWQKGNPSTRSFFALSSHMYNGYQEHLRVQVQTEPKPIGVYALSKVKMWELIRTYRENFGVSASALILFNHTSQYSKDIFVLQTISSQIAQTLHKKSSCSIQLQKNTFVDISDAHEFAFAFLLCAQFPKVKDWILASGIASRISNIVIEAFCYFDIKDFELIFKEPPSNQKLVGDVSDTFLDLGWQTHKKASDIVVDLIKIRKEFLSDASK